MAVMVYWFGAPQDWLMTFLVLLCKDKVASPALERSEAHNHLDKVVMFPLGEYWASSAGLRSPKLGPAAGGQGGGGRGRRQAARLANARVEVLTMDPSAFN